VDPQSPVGQVVSGNEERENNDESVGLYESPSDPCPSVKEAIFWPTGRGLHTKRRGI
jgi:hypothetical protein